MNLKAITLLLSILLIISLGTYTRAQDDDDEEGARGSFLKTRPSKSEGDTKKNTIIGTNTPHRKPTPIGLGYTLYMRDANGRAVRVDPNREFHSGDQIRLTLEANTNGYLYVFHIEGNGEPEMIFPDSN